MASNCYGYAIGVDGGPCPGTRNGRKSEVSNWTGGFEKYPFIDRQKEVLLEACLSDGLWRADNSMRQIALFVHCYNDCIDFHFYRLDVANGSWSMKDSYDDQPIEGILDPREYDRGLVRTELATGTLVGQKYAGLLYLPSGDDMQGGWPED